MLRRCHSRPPPVQLKKGISSSALGKTMIQTWSVIPRTEKENVQINIHFQEIAASTAGYRPCIYNCRSQSCLGAGVAQRLDLWLKGRRFESQQERRENFLLQGQLPVLSLVSVSVPSCYRSSTWKIPVILPKVQVAGYSWTRMHPTYVALHEVTWHGAWSCGVPRIPKTRRDGRSFTCGTNQVTTKQRCTVSTPFCWIL